MGCAGNKSFPSSTNAELAAIMQKPYTLREFETQSPADYCSHRKVDAKANDGTFNKIILPILIAVLLFLLLFLVFFIRKKMKYSRIDVIWLCPLSVELKAARCVLGDLKPNRKVPNAYNYTFGEVHNNEFRNVLN